MAKYSLKAKLRALTGKQAAKVRAEEMIPAVLYGQGIKNQNISIKKTDFLKVFNQAGSSNLVELEIDNAKPVITLIQDIQKDPTTNDIIHADFYQIKEGQKITTHAELKFVGEAPAVKSLGGVLIKNIDVIEIECLAKDLEKLENITIDLSVLETLDDVITIKDLHLPGEIKVLANPDEVVALITEEKEEIIEQAPAEGELPEGAEPKEGEPAAEGQPDTAEQAPVENK